MTERPVRSVGTKESDYLDLENQVNDLETDVAVVGRDVKTLFSAVEKLAGEFRDYARETADAMRDMRNSGRIGVGGWVGIIGLILVMFSGTCTVILLVIQTSISPIEARQSVYEQIVAQHIQELKEHQRSDGHTETMAQLRANDVEVREIKRRLGILEQDWRASGLKLNPHQLQH